MLDMLFKRTVTGAIQVWEIETDIHNGRYRTISGKLNGAMVTSEWTVAKQKNKGRANATTPAEQCMREAQAAWEKKQRDGYSLTIDAALGSERFQCMLAVNWNDEDPRAQALIRKRAMAAAAKGELISQAKLDGVRCIATRHGLQTRKGRPIVAAPHVLEEFQDLFVMFPEAIIDGELFNYELREDFNAIVSLCRKTKLSDLTLDELDYAKETIQYWVYDAVDLGVGRDAVYSARWSALQDLLPLESGVVNLLPMKVVRNQEQIDKIYETYLAQGDEGQILRIDAPYENKRSAFLIKRKEYEDKEFRVISILEGEGNRTGQAGLVWILLENGAESKSGIKGDKAFRIKLLNERDTYIDGDVTIRFNGRTPDKVPRFPRAVAWYPGGRDV